MSVTEVTARISQIQAELASLSAPVATASRGVTAAAPFSDAMDAAQAAGAGDSAGVLPSDTGGAGQLAGATGAFPLPATGITGIDDVGAAGGGSTGQAVVAEAKKYLGIPYLWGGTDPKKGLDCSGFVQLVYKHFGIDLPRVSYQQATAGRPVSGLAAARPGDILAFDNPVDHVAIYVGGGKMIEAPRTGLDVRIVDVYKTPSSIRRVLPEQSTAAVGPARALASTSALPPGTPYAALFTQAGRANGVNPALLAAVAQQESGFNARAVSPAGARGLMQLMPGTAAGLGVRDSFDPAQAVNGAARLLKDLIGEFGRVDLALAAYNAGPGAVHRYGGIPPYPETRRYVPAVLAHKAALERA